MSREAFEANYASSHDLPLETFSQYRMGDTYRLPGIASHWRTWQMALASAESFRKDAERLRWLREHEFDVGSFHGVHEHNAKAWFEHISDDDIDRAIEDQESFEAEMVGGK